MSLLLVIDQSTSATKALLFDAFGQLLDKTSLDHRQIYPRPGWVEHDAEEIWQNTLRALKSILERNHARVSDIACLSITNQRETIVVFDLATGRPLHHAIVWQCRRGDPLCQKLRESGQEDLVRAKTGLKIDTYFSASKLKWLMAEKPDLAMKLKSGEAGIATIDAYLTHRLTEGRVFATDYTNASRTLLLDIGKLCWDEQLCALFDVPMRALPEVRESAAQFGETDMAGLLPRRIPIFGVMGDSQASLFAQGCYRPGMAKATFGTGTSILLNVGNQLCVSQKGGVTALGWVWRNQPTYALEGIINFSAATIEWLKNQLGLIQNTIDVEALATKVDDNGGVYLVPAFAGLSAPHWSPEARGAILGLTAFTRREHIIRAAHESIAYQIRDVLDAMRTDMQLPLLNLHADGNPTSNRFLMQFTADIAGVELKVSDVAESSAWGAALSGLLGLGICQSLDDLTALPREKKSFTPEMSAEKVRLLHDGWLAAVKRVL